MDVSFVIIAGDADNRSAHYIGVVWGKSKSTYTRHAAVIRGVVDTKKIKLGSSSTKTPYDYVGNQLNIAGQVMVLLPWQTVLAAELANTSPVEGHIPEVVPTMERLIGENRKRLTKLEYNTYYWMCTRFQPDLRDGMVNAPDYLDIEDIALIEENRAPANAKKIYY